MQHAAPVNDTPAALYDDELSYDASFQDKPDRHRTGVFNAIKKARQKLEQHCPELVRHLSERIETGSTCIYLNPPGDHLDWQFEYGS